MSIIGLYAHGNSHVIRLAVPMQLLFDAFDDELKTKTDNDALDVDAGSEDDNSQMEDSSDVQKMQIAMLKTRHHRIFLP